MFRQVKSPAYGTGIASNLVSNEERQRYNYGGRVGLYRGADTYGLSYGRIPPGAFNQMSDLTETIYTDNQKPPTNWWDVYSTGEQDYKYQIPEGEEDAGQIVDRTTIYKKPKSKDEILQEKIEADFETEGEDFKPLTASELKAARDKLPSLPVDDKNQDDKNQLAGTEFREQETETIDVDPFAFLDKSIEEKKKLAKGNALMKAAAAAVKWGGASTAEKRAAAISEGLTGFGDEASKATAAAMDLKDRAKILAATQGMKDEAAYARQELKGKQTEDIWNKRIAAVKRDPNLTDKQRFDSLMDLPGGQTGQGIAKALRAVLGGKRGVADSIDVNNPKQLAKIQNGTIVVSLEGRVGIKDDSKAGTGGIDWSVSVEEILEG